MSILSFMDVDVRNQQVALAGTFVGVRFSWHVDELAVEQYIEAEYGIVARQNLDWDSVQFGIVLYDSAGALTSVNSLATRFRRGCWGAAITTAELPTVAGGDRDPFLCVVVLGSNVTVVDASGVTRTVVTPAQLMSISTPITLERLAV